MKFKLTDDRGCFKQVLVYVYLAGGESVSRPTELSEKKRSLEPSK